MHNDLLLQYARDKAQQGYAPIQIARHLEDLMDMTAPAMDDADADAEIDYQQERAAAYTYAVAIAENDAECDDAALYATAQCQSAERAGAAREGIMDQWLDWYQMHKQAERTAARENLPIGIVLAVQEGIRSLSASPRGGFLVAKIDDGRISLSVHERGDTDDA